MNTNTNGTTSSRLIDDVIRLAEAEYCETSTPFLRMALQKMIEETNEELTTMEALAQQLAAEENDDN